MYQHPYLAYKVTEFDQDQLQQAVELRRFIADHSDQIVPRPAGRVRRMLNGMLNRMRRGGASPAATVPEAAGATAPGAAATAAASAAADRASRVREPATAR